MASFYKVPANNKKGYKWVCVADGPPDPITGKRNQIKRRGETQKEAENRVNEVIKKQTDDGIDVKAVKNLTFDKVAVEWLDTYSRGKRKKNTIRLRKNSIKILNGYIAAVNIEKITHKTHQRILNDLHDKGFSRSHIEGVHVTANLIYKFAIKEKYRKDNPATGATIPENTKTVEEIESNPIEEKYLERHELSEFLAAAQQHGLRDDVEMFYLLAFGGMRSGEMIALKETDFFFETNKIRITKTLYNPDNNLQKYELTTPKSDAGIRVLDMDPAVMKLIEERMRQQNKIINNIKQLDPNYHDKQFIFCNEQGYPYIQKTVIRRMDRLLRKTSIRKKATPHIFRHTHISMLAEAGVDLITIMKRVGHDDSETTLKIYTHVTEKMKKDATEKVNNHFSDILQGIVLPTM